LSYIGEKPNFGKNSTVNLVQTSLERLEWEVRRLRLENTRLEEELEGAKGGAARHAALEKELAQLKWQIAKMEDSRHGVFLRSPAILHVTSKGSVFLLLSFLFCEKGVAKRGWLVWSGRG
jgi:hypothetical protein